MQADKRNFCTIDRARGRHSKNAEIYICLKIYAHTCIAMPDVHVYESISFIRVFFFFVIYTLYMTTLLTWS